MAPKGRKAKKTSTKSSTSQKRSERRFSTNLTHMPLLAALVGIGGCFALGVGVFGLWILDEPLSYASYLVALGGLGLGLAMWFGQPAENAVAVGDAGVALENDREVKRIPWFELRSLRVNGNTMSIEGQEQSLSFSIRANADAASAILKEAAERVPDVLDVDAEVMKSLPAPDRLSASLSEVTDDQVSGARCANSDKLIALEADARFCKKCGQLYHREEVPELCKSCDEPLKDSVLTA